MNCIILTPLALEFEAVKQHLPNCINVSGFPYTAVQSAFKGQHTTFQITLIQAGVRTNTTTLATEKAITSFQPNLIFLTGIAGGIKDAGIGDVVVANQVYGYESGKETPTGFVARPNIKPFSSILFQQAQATSSQLRNKPYHVFFGAIASGDKVVASTDSPVYRRIKQHYNDTLALEMESLGFAEAVMPYRSIHALHVRGISDLLDGKSAADAEGTQERAVANAADFIFELLKYLNPKSLNIPTMNIQKIEEIVKKTVNLVFPLLKLDSVKKIGQEFKEATDTSILEMWQLIKPVFIEEFEAEKELGRDMSSDSVQADLKSAVERQLMRSLSKNKEQAKKLHLILEKNNPPSSSNIANHSKNINQGVINAQSVNIGDKTTTYNIDRNEGDMTFNVK